MQDSFKETPQANLLSSPVYAGDRLIQRELDVAVVIKCRQSPKAKLDTPAVSDRIDPKANLQADPPQAEAFS
jgi:hypothetical protein